MATVEVGLKSSSNEALLNDAELVVEDTDTLFLAATVEVDVSREHASVRVSIGDKLVVIGSLLLSKRNELVLVDLDSLSMTSLGVFLDSHSSKSDALLVMLGSSLDLLVTGFISMKCAMHKEGIDFRSRPVDGVVSSLHVCVFNFKIDYSLIEIQLLL